MSTSVRLTSAEQENFPTVLRTIVGSEVHGTGLPGLGDIDHLGLAVGNPLDALGIGSDPESWGYRSAWERDNKDPRSQTGDLDLLVYPVRKWAAIAFAGNPSALDPLFVDEKYIVSQDEFGSELRANRHRFISRRLGAKHLGYMVAQRKRMVESTGMRVNRPELVLAYGYDVKFAAHMLRLGHQGVSVLVDHKVAIPLSDDVAASILAVRRGERTMEDVLEESARLEAVMVDVLEAGDFTQEADLDWIQDWLRRVQLNAWA